MSIRQAAPNLSISHARLALAASGNIGEETAAKLLDRLSAIQKCEADMLYRIAEALAAAGHEVVVNDCCHGTLPKWDLMVNGVPIEIKIVGQKP